MALVVILKIQEFLRGTEIISMLLSSEFRKQNISGLYTNRKKAFWKTKEALKRLIESRRRNRPDDLILPLFNEDDDGKCTVISIVTESQAMDQHQHAEMRNTHVRDI